MKKKLLYIILLIFFLVFFKIFLILYLESYLSKTLQQVIELEDVTLLPLKMKTTSLGGVTNLHYEDDNFILTLKDVSLSSFEKINKTQTRKKMIIHSGKVNGTLTYNPYTETTSSKLVAHNVVINGINLDQKLRFYNDVLGFNIVSLFRNFLKNIDTSNKTTRISQFQFNMSMHEKFITLRDVAFNSKNFRIVLYGKVHTEGYIDNFSAHLVDKNGCSIISQELVGNITDPKIRKTKTIKKIVKTVPVSLFNTGMKVANFTKYTLQSVMPKNEYHISNQFLSKSDIMFQRTSKIVMPKECKVIYTGKVAHPTAYKKGFI